MRTLFVASAFLLAASAISAQAASNLSSVRVRSDDTAIQQVREASEGPRREDRRQDRREDRRNP